jgi:hypothetical protein
MLKANSFCLLILSGLCSILLPACSHKAPATRQDRQKWNQTMLAQAYQSGGHTNPKWDGDAQDALSNYAHTKTASDDEMEVLAELTGDAAESAINAGCDDPLIRYLRVRFSSTVKAKLLPERQQLYKTAADALQNSSYPPLAKFYANLDAAEMLWAQRDKSLWPDVVQHRHGAMDALTQAVQDKSLPEAEAFQAAQNLFELLARNPSEMTNAYNRLDAVMSGAHLNSATPEFIKATFYKTYAWEARGHGTADKVSQAAWDLFWDRLGIAGKALQKAYSRDPQDPEIPTAMIGIALGLQNDRAEMEKWFERAMKADPKNYQACRAKLNFLAPRWYGSRDDLLAFGRQCVANTNWAGQVPLTLVEAHRDFYRSLSGDDRKGYWLYSDVWPDIKASYERFAQANPDETHFRYPYAWYAFSCGQMEDFKEQIKIIRQNEKEVSYSYFGGKEAFDQLEAVANGKEPLTNAVPERQN